MTERVSIFCALKKIIFALGFLCISNFIYAQDNLDSLLIKLDNALEKSHIYIQKREDRIKVLKSELKTIRPNSKEEYVKNAQLYKEYKPYILDSALHYQNRNIDIARNLKDIKSEFASKIQLAYIMGSTGMYNEAVDLMATIDENQLPEELLVDYYYTYLKVYNELAFYTQDKKARKITGQSVDNTIKS